MGYNLWQERMLSGTKTIFFEVWSIPGGKYAIVLTHSLLEGDDFCEVPFL